jgi:hypothetical protein
MSPLSNVPDDGLTNGTASREELNWRQGRKEDLGVVPLLSPLHFTLLTIQYR